MQRRVHPSARPARALRLEWVRPLVRFASGLGLGAKITLLVILGTGALIALFAYLGTAALEESTLRTLQERVVLAQTTARHIDYVLANIEDVLRDSAAREPWTVPGSVEGALDRTYRRVDFFATRVFLTDSSGNVLAAQPPLTTPLSLRHFASLSAVFGGRPFAISRFMRPLEGIGGTTIAATPIRDDEGLVTGALVACINLTAPNIRTFTHPIGLGNTGYMDLVDLGGVILASTRPERIGRASDHGDTLAQFIRERRQSVSACHDCHTTSADLEPTNEVLAFAPLDQAQWGVTVRQSEDEVFAATRTLQLRIFALILAVVAGGLAVLYMTTHSVLRPVQALTVATQRMAAGDLDTPLQVGGRDEIGVLAQSFDTMRIRLRNSIEEIHAWNRELDARVQEGMAAFRAAQEQKEQLRRELLHRVIAAQEEERKRISRELHDETCQLLTGLAYALDDAAEARSLEEVRALLERMHGMTKNTLSGVHRMIFDLRPTLLDNLGLIPALRWYAETRLSDQGIQFTIREVGGPRRLPAPVETAVFRVVQEAINNIALHSHARHADFVFDLRDDWVDVRITDDGCGFDAAGLNDAPDGKRGLGLMGMQERMTAIGGELHLRSVPGGGTALRLIAPLDQSVAPDWTEEQDHV